MASTVQFVPDIALQAEHGVDTLASRFADVCAQYGDRVAVTVGSESINYRQLNDAATRVASVLLALHIPKNALVAVYLDRSLDMIVAMLGVIKAGAAYLPIDPTYPEARVRETLADALPAAVLTDSLRSETLHTAGRVLILSELLTKELPAAHAPEVRPNDLAYVIYTSGSTGRPKGVMVTHRNVVRLFDQTQHCFEFDEHDVWTMFHSFAFDFSVWEIWGALLHGGRLVIVPFEISRSPEDFYALLSDEDITVLNQTPTAFSMLVQAEALVPARPLALRFVIFGGETLNLRSLLPWFSRHGDAEPALVNMYGITETTVHVTYRQISQNDAEHETESLIGEPIPDLSIQLLDENLLPVADGEVGEICVGGAGVSRGYLNRPELTAERFVLDPSSESGERLYRSGDLARQRADGELVYLGRRDFQVKINGFRIELGEIETVLAGCPGVAQVCVDPRGDGATAKRLAAYIVSANGSFDAKAISQFAEAHLPSHMRPSFYTRMEALPINANGKVDRSALPAPQATATIAPVRANTVTASPLEPHVATLWRKVLKTENVGPEENFFDVGGTSLLLIALRTELQTALNFSIPVTWLFEHTTIRSLAAKLSTASISANEPATTANQSLLQSNAQQQRNSFARMRALRSIAQ